jgi:ATP-binding cassette, subfamily B, bacterial PglK
MSSQGSGFANSNSEPHGSLGALAALVRILPKRRRIELAGITALMILSGAAEVVTLGAVLPLLGLLSGAGDFRGSWIVEITRTILPFPNLSVASALTFVFGSAALFAGAIRIGLVYATAHFSSSIGFELGAEVFRRTVEQPYEQHITKNSSEVLAALNKIDAVVYSILSMMYVMTGLFVGSLILFALLFIDSLSTIISAAALAATYGLFSLLARHRIAFNSKEVNQSLASRFKITQEVLGGMRDVVLGHTRQVFTVEFNRVNYSLYRARASNDVIGPTPRCVIEALGMVIIASLAYWLTVHGGIGYALPTLGALALGLQRLLPLIQQTYNGFVTLGSSSHSIADVLALISHSFLRNTDYTGNPLPFHVEIELRHVTFSYPAQNFPVLADVCMKVRKGARVGILGPTGSGKSTLVDLIMGLLAPAKGSVLVDGFPLEGTKRFAWQKNIAHVPQNPFLLDASFAANIAFGTQESGIDLVRVKRAARDAQLSEFIERQSQGYYTTVGERGMGLSGGQRQRIAIARALYKEVSVLVLDEATSALDRATEDAVMKSIDRLGRDLTIFVIAHRVDTLRSCDMLMHVQSGRVTEVSSEVLSSLDYQAGPRNPSERSQVGVSRSALP